jgi:hypothetical protein
VNLAFATIVESGCLCAFSQSFNPLASFVPCYLSAQVARSSLNGTVIGNESA